MGQPLDRPRPPVLAGVRVALACSFCHDELRRGRAVFCAACLAPHHADCVREHGGCSAPGCGERRVVRPGSASRARRGLGRLLLAGVVVGVVALAQAAREQHDDLARREQRLRVQQRRLEAVRARLDRQDGERRERERQEHVAEAEAGLEREVDAIFQEIERLAQERQVEELIVQFMKLRDLLEDAGGRVDPATVERWLRRLAELGEGKHLDHHELHFRIRDGNRCLRLMADAIKREDWDRVHVGWLAVRWTVAQMRANEREMFHRNADALESRGRALSERASALRAAAYDRTRAAVAAASAATSPSDTPR